MRSFRSAPTSPRSRGTEFGQIHATDVRRVVDHYAELFTRVAGRDVDLMVVGAEAAHSIEEFSPDAFAEIAGIADGAGLPVESVAAINARTEILAQVGAPQRGECSTVVHLGGQGDAPVSVQTWDWHDLLDQDWLLWTIEHPDGTVVHTITEYGILGKIGVNSRGVGVHFNILHHASDGGAIGVPVHVLARTVLDRARGIGGALSVVSAAQTSASTVLTLVAADHHGSSAICAELSPLGPRFVLPDTDGLLLHTNHFLDPNQAAGDLEPRRGPDSFLRLDVLRRSLSGHASLSRDGIVEAMASHLGAGGAVCCHPDVDAVLGDRWATLVTVSLDVANATLSARAGGPCNVAAPWETPAPTRHGRPEPQRL